MGKKKTCSVTVSVRDDIVEQLIWTEDITEPETHKAMMDEIIAIEKSSNVKNKLVDIRNLRGRLGIFEIYNFVRDYPPDRPKMKTAIVDCHHRFNSRAVTTG